jgi:hypothetical protein
MAADAMDAGVPDQHPFVTEVRRSERELLVGHRLERQPVQRRDPELLDRGAVLGGE